VDESSDSAKLADFGTVRAHEVQMKAGLATEGVDLKMRGKTHATTQRVVGTGPYMPPEYTAYGHVSAKTGT
jgi:serine/threonine protein kinase